MPAPHGSVTAFALFDDVGREGVFEPAQIWECGGLCLVKQGGLEGVFMPAPAGECGGFCSI